MFLRSASLLVVGALFAAACTTGGGSPTPTTGATSAPSSVPSTLPSTAPTSAPTDAATPGASLDPSQSDAGVVGMATVDGDQRADRDGTYGIVGVDADGSSCETNFEGDQFLVSAADESAPNGQIRSIFVNVPVDAVPDTDGASSAPIRDQRAGFDFASDQFAGTLYVGEPADDARTTMSITVSRADDNLVFAFAGTTWDGVAITGTMACASAA